MFVEKGRKAEGRRVVLVWRPGPESETRDERHRDVALWYCG
jgi:hypothetical protein